MDTSHQVHLYRTTLPPDSGRGLVIRFHPRSGSFRVADDVQPPVDELMVCGHDVGMDGGRLPDSCQLVPIGGSVDIGDGGEAHVAVELVAPGIEPVFVPELVVSYEPADGFLGVEFPG